VSKTHWRRSKAITVITDDAWTARNAARNAAWYDATGHATTYDGSTDDVVAANDVGPAYDAAASDDATTNDATTEYAAVPPAHAVAHDATTYDATTNDVTAHGLTTNDSAASLPTTNASTKCPPTADSPLHGHAYPASSAGDSPLTGLYLASTYSEYSSRKGRTREENQGSRS